VKSGGRRFSADWGATGLNDWSISEVRVPERTRPLFACPEDVFRQEYDRLVRALTLVAGEREVAADAVQEAFIRLVGHWDQVSKYEDPAGWVRKVALNRIRDHRRSLWRQTGLLLRIQQECPASEGSLASDQGLWDRLRTLPPRQRTVIALRYVGDLTNREIAEVMHVSEGTVDRHLQRALRSLKLTLEGASDE
jgi:RNA polymerase sigma-70 factor, ECF subfamily